VHPSWGGSSNPVQTPSFGIHTDVATCFRSFERMRAVADVILPSHDANVLTPSVDPAGQ
jgi:hypothetical protein